MCVFIIFCFQLQRFDGLAEFLTVEVPRRVTASSKKGLFLLRLFNLFIIGSWRVQSLKKCKIKCYVPIDSWTAPHFSGESSFKLLIWTTNSLQKPFDESEVFLDACSTSLGANTFLQSAQ